MRTGFFGYVDFIEQKPASEFLKKGNYMVNVYDNGFKIIGNSKFQLK